MSRSRVPVALLDALRARASIFIPGKSPRYYATGSSAFLHSKRSAHAAAFKVKFPDADLIPEHEFYASKGADQSKGKEVLRFGELPSWSLTPLEQRVMELKNATITEESIAETSGFTEEELLAVYEDLLANPINVAPEVRKVTPELETQYQAIVEDMVKRLLPSISDIPENGAVSSFAHRLQSIRAGIEAGIDRFSEGSSNTSPTSAPSVPTHLALIAHLEEAVAQIESAKLMSPPPNANVMVDTDGDALLPPPPVKITLITSKEWSALIYACVAVGDLPSAERVLDLMGRTESKPSEDILDRVLSHYANTGDIARADHFVEHHLEASPTENQRDLHIRAYLKNESPAAFPNRSLNLLHSYELRGTPAPQKSYTSLITHLFSVKDAVAYAHAWDLFSHMRYVAHSKPDALLYTLMIRACASSSLTSRGDPERAMDLFLEMTHDQGIAPTAGAYTATILALARSGEDVYVQEAFRLAKEMMDAHRDARGYSAFTPDRKFFIALLQGAKRVGDLGKTRWILAEMVREYNSQPSSSHNVINEEIMLHVFHAYSAYRPPFKREATLLVDSNPAATTVSETVPQDQQVDGSSTSPEPQSTDMTEVDRPSLSELPPQTSPEVLAEAGILFRRMIEDIQNTHESRGAFHKVELTARLVNAYLAVHATHSSIAQYTELFKSLHAKFGVPRNAWTYVEALERCAVMGMKRKHERVASLQLADEIWQEWQAIENEWKTPSASYAARTTTARLLEQMYAARIRVLALTRQIDRAMETVKVFVQRYPPAAIREPMPKLSARSTRVSLVAARPLVRMTSEVDIPDDHVPPLLSFPEVAVLHGRLVSAGRIDDIKYLKWMCKSYEGALRVRRDRAMQARPRASSPPF